MPPVPADIRTCFEKQVPPPEAGKPLSKVETYDLITDLVVLDKEKTSCGRRLIARDDALRAGKIKTAP